MPFRFATFFIASVAGAACATALFGLYYFWVGAWAGALGWWIYDARRAQRVLQALRSDATVWPDLGHGVWSELADRIRRQFKSREREIKQAETRLQEFLAAIQVSPNGVVLLDPDGRIEWCNQNAAQHFGIDPERDLEQHLANLVRDPAFISYLAGWDYGKEVSINAPGDAVGTRRATPRRLAIQAHPYNGDRRMILTRDITAMEQADATRRDFVANVSHEIRTPLTVLSGFVETMQTLPLGPDEQRRYLGLMAQQSHRMQTLVSDLLTLSRLEGSALQASGQWVGMTTLVDRCVQEARGLSEMLGMESHSIILDVAGHPVEVFASPTELQSAMSNLLSNAVRYTPMGARIDVRWSLRPDGSGEFSVADSGPGIAPEHIPRLTERFYRVDRSRSRETGGTGLGLAIVKHVVQRHGAELTIVSRVGEGSCFAIVLPAARLRPVEAPVSASDAASATAAS